MLTSEQIAIPQSPYAMFERMYEEGWTDGLPVIPPTDDLVQKFMDYTGRDAQEVIGLIAPDNAPATIEKVAINAVMAGCKPEYMPVLLAALEAALDPRFNLGGVQVTTNPISPMVIIHGPIRNQLDVNCRTNALGQGRRANATIGRALNLLTRNVGGATPGTVSKSTIGQPGRYTFCLGEDEEESPWEPFHVERGLSRGQSAVTVVGACGSLSIHMGQSDAERMLHILSHSIAILGDTGMLSMQGGEAFILLCPPHARVFAEAGLSKQDIQRILWERARIPMDLFPEDSAERKRVANAIIDGMGLLTLKPEDIKIVVAGGDGSNHSTYIPNLGCVSYSVTRPIK